MDKYYVFACDLNGNRVCIYMDEREIERISPINRASSLQSIPKLIRYAIDYYQADHVEILPV